MYTNLSSYGLTYGLCISFVTAIVINRCNFIFKYFESLYPPNVRQGSDEYRRWKWRNFLISFIHSIITGIGSLLCVLYKPRLLIEVISEYLEMSYLLVSFSHGYFIYDLIEMLTHLRYKGSKELVVHHILILCCFSLTVCQQKYHGYGSIALLIELSNIFLHFRQLLLIIETPKTSTIYWINSHLNLIIFVVVRVSCLFWLWVTLIWVLPRVPPIPQMIAFITLIGIGLMTCILFLRIYRSDFSVKKSKEFNSSNGKSLANQSVGPQTNDNETQSNGLLSDPMNHSMHSKTS